MLQAKIIYLQDVNCAPAGGGLVEPPLDPNPPNPPDDGAPKEDCPPPPPPRFPKVGVALDNEPKVGASLLAAAAPKPVLATTGAEPNAGAPPKAGGEPKAGAPPKAGAAPKPPVLGGEVAELTPKPELPMVLPPPPLKY